MEWDSRTCAWNGISKLEVEDNSYNHHLAATLACSSGSGLTNMFSVDLNLGRLEDMPDLSMETFNNSVPTNMGPTHPPPTSPAMVLSKRGRPRNNGAQTTVFCAVDGCTSDLNRCRDYHRRHRVCERHSKTPVVLVAGKEQRFCQQCSRFHSLEEFDEVKRSCRKRLDGHNRRRRKRQPEAFYMPDSAGGFLSSQTGDGMMQFCCPQVHTSNWPTISQPDLYYRNNQETVYHPVMNEIAPTQSRRGCLKTSPENESGCALSLLSMCPSQSSAISVGPITSPSPPPQGSNSTSLNLNGLVQLSFSQGSAALSSSNNTNNPGFGGFHSTQDGFRANGSSKFFPFGWD